MHPLIRNGTRLKEIAEHTAVGIAAWPPMCTRKKFRLRVNHMTVYKCKKKKKKKCESHDHMRCASLRVLLVTSK